MSIRCGRESECDEEAKKIYDFVKRYHVYLSSDLDDESVKAWMKADGVMPLDAVRVINQRAYSRKKAEEDAKNAELNKKLEHGCALSLLILFLLIFIPMVIISIAKNSSTIQ